MNNRILIVEDDRGISDAVSLNLQFVGYDYMAFDDGAKAAAYLNEDHAFDIALLDIMLPFFDGYHWCSEIRRVSKVPIIFISSAADNMNIVMAMNLGADDFISKPFDGSVLMAKIQALLRRTYDFGASVPVLEHRGALLDTGENSLVFGSEKITLTKNEYRILLCLMENKGKVVSREKLMERLWETDAFVDENTLTVNVNRLRKKLDAAGLKEFIATKFGVGYIIA